MPDVIVLKDLESYIDAAIWHDYLIGILITSASEGKLASLGIDYGVGKSTLMLRLAYLFLDKYGDKFTRNPCFSRDEKWNRVFSMLRTFPYELEEFFFNAPKRYFGEPVFLLYDDMQRTLGKTRSRDTYVRSLCERASTARNQLAVLIGTAPDIGTLAYPWRYFFNFEVIIPERGYYEVQRLKKWKPFDNPYQTYVKLDYKGEVSRQIGSAPFPRLDSDIEDRYQNWRTEANRRFDEGEGEIRLRSFLNVLSEEAKELVKDLVAKGSYTRQQIITGMNKSSEMKLLQNCGLAEVFGDLVVPTKQARKLVNVI
jgi:hypothetical protein